MPLRSNRRNGPARPNPEVVRSRIASLAMNSLILLASARNLVTAGTKNLLAQRALEHEHNKANGGVEPFTEQSPRLQIQDGGSPQQQQQQLEPSPSLARQNNEPLLQGATPQADFHLPPLP